MIYASETKKTYLCRQQSLFIFTTNQIMSNNRLTIRPAQPEECGLVLEFINRLAVYEKCADEVVSDESTLYHSLFVERSAEVVFADLAMAKPC